MAASSDLGADYWSTQPFGAFKAELVRRAGVQHPLEMARREDVERAVASLPSIEPDAWVRAWSALVDQYEDLARTAEAAGQIDRARAAYLQAAAYCTMARFPSPSSPPKQAAYARGIASFLAASRFFPHPFERIELPYAGRSGEGDRLVLYLQRPSGVERAPVVVLSGGIDQFKEDCYRDAQPLLDAGLAVAIYDMPGTGESPVSGAADTRPLYDALLGHLAARPDVDGTRIGMVGRSFGGYWATRTAHTHRDSLRAVVNWGGSVHHAFQPEHVRRSRAATSYLFELLETRARAFGLQTAEQYLEAAPGFSLLEQGILSEPCVPMLLVNGKDDQQVPIADLYLLLEHGSPKLARVFPGGHLGPISQVHALIQHWLQEQLARPPSLGRAVKAE